MTVTTATRSTRFLYGLATVFLAVSALFGLFLLVGAALGFGPSGDEVAVHTQVDGDHLTPLPHGALPPDNVDVLVRIREATATQMRWAAARDLPAIAVALLVLWLMRRLLKSVSDGDPFTLKNVNRLRAIAWVVLAGVPFAVFVSSMCASELANSAGLDGSGPNLTMPPGALFGGLGAFVLAAVFAAGVRMRDDLEGTV